MAAVEPQIIDPKTTSVLLTSTVKYNSSKTTLTAETIKTNISNTVYQYGQTELGLFTNEFRYSPLITQVDQTENSIESSLTTVKLKRTFTPTLNVASSYTLSFSNKVPSTSNTSQIQSNQFSHYDDDGILRTACELQDANGVLQVYRTVGANRIVVANNVGAVTYSSGNVALTTFKPTAITDGSVNVTVTTALSSNDVKPLREQILLIANSDITIAMVDTLGTGKTTTTSVTSTATSSSGSY